MNKTFRLTPLLLLYSLDAHGIPAYNIIGLDAPGNATYVFAINNSGVVVGADYIAGDGVSAAHPYFYDGTVHALASDGAATDINDAGQIVGQSGGSAFLYDGSMHMLGVLPADAYSAAFGINNAGVIVGNSIRSGHSTGFVYDGSMHALGSLPGGTYGEAAAINDVGQIAGSSGSVVQIGDSNVAVSHAVLYDEGIHDLGVLPGFESSYASGINNSGTVVGYSWRPLSNEYRSFIYDGAMHDLGTLAGADQTIAYDINEAGQVVGASYSPGWSAFLYDNGSIWNLNDLIAPDSGWQLGWATGINDLGQIAGYGVYDGQLSGFLLTLCADCPEPHPPTTPPTPVPEPATYALLLAGLSLLSKKTTRPVAVGF